VRTLTVRGYGSVDAEPDRVDLSLALTAVAPTADAAYADVAARAVRLSAVLDELGVPAISRRTAGLGLHEEHGPDGPSGFRAFSRMFVRLGDADAAAAVIARAVEAAGAGVDGLGWSVDHESPAWLDACRRAGSSARERAAAYAQGLGLPLGDVVGAVEPGTAQVVAAEPARMRGMTINHAVEPGQTRVGATLDVTFALGEDADD
jgi:uncharacterized protein YggE